jgi:tetratricopeptide (TPR) repeat protein
MPEETRRLGWTYFFAGRYDDAIAQLRETLELHPDDTFARHVLSWCYAVKGMHEEAIAEGERAAGRAWREYPDRVGLLGWIYGLAGQQDRARECLDELAALSARMYVDPWDHALVHAGLGDDDRAFEWLEKGYEQRSIFMPLLKVAPLTPSLRADPRMQDLVRRMGFPESISTD